jgi:hypothetical protein
MDRLDKTKQAEIRKLSDARLVGQLAKAGVPTEELESLDRTELMNRWAEIVLTGKEAGHVKAEAAATVSVAYDIEWEKQKALMQASQWEQEMAERRAQRELEMRRFEAELAERKLREMRKLGAWKRRQRKGKRLGK